MLGRSRMLLFGIAALALAMAAGGAAFAMRGGDDGTPSESARQAEDPDDSGAGGTRLAACVEGATDCDDTVGPADEPLPGGDAGCTPEECYDPGVVRCEPGQTLEACFPDGVPAGYDCLTLETFPEQVVCKIACPPVDLPLEPLPVEPDGPVSILPVPAEDGSEPTLEEQPIATAVAGTAVAAPECILPDEPCDPATDPAVGCLPPDCSVSSDGSVACPDPAPCIDGEGITAPTSENCKPPCVVSSDGTVACPEPAPCAVDPDGSTAPEDQPCSSPGSCGDLGCDPPCPPDQPDLRCVEEMPPPPAPACAPDDDQCIAEEERRGGSSGSGSSGSGPIIVD